MAEEPSFDQIVARLREVVTRLESGELSLEQSLEVYEAGVQLARRGQQLLAAAEKRVEILVSASGTVEVAPFELNEHDPRDPRDGEPAADKPPQRNVRATGS
jgi:exodeoxyribonuclease VII small subunit